MMYWLAVYFQIGLILTLVDYILICDNQLRLLSGSRKSSVTFQIFLVVLTAIGIIVWPLIYLRNYKNKWVEIRKPTSATKEGNHE